MTDRSRSPSLSLTIQEAQQHEFLLPTPVSPTTTTTHNMNAYIGQFSLKTPASDSDKLYTCIECGQQFNRAHNLKLHKAVHSASKSFQCTECEKAFLRLHDLKRHQKLHTGEKPYHCPLCSKSFSRLDALNRHRKTEGSCVRKHSLDSASSWHVMTPSTPRLMPATTSLPSNDDEVDKLRQRVHDLEIENRVLRSLIEEKNSLKRQRTP